MLSSQYLSPEVVYFTWFYLPKKKTQTSFPPGPVLNITVMLLVLASFSIQIPSLHCARTQPSKQAWGLTNESFLATVHNHDKEDLIVNYYNLQMSLLMLNSITTKFRGASWRRRQEGCRSQRMGRVLRKAVFRADAAITTVSSRQLWLPGQDLHMGKPVKTLA